jgi:hypothetical protein
MKPSHASQIRQAAVTRGDMSRYEASHRGGLSILERSRPTAFWSRVSPAILCEIDRHVHALAGRRQ